MASRCSIAIVMAAGGLSAIAATPGAAQNRPAYPGINCNLYGPRHACPPYLLYPYGQDLRITVRAQEIEHQGEPSRGSVDTPKALFAALRACWHPPTIEDGQSGMELTVRFSLRRDGSFLGTPRFTYVSQKSTPPQRDLYRRTVLDGLHDCTPLGITKGLGGAIAGRPITIRYIDDRSAPQASL